jgi:hypothetical protein
MLSLWWETFIAFWLRARKQEAYTRLLRIASRQTMARLRIFTLVKTNPFLFLEGELEFQVGDEKIPPGPVHSFKGREALHTVLGTTRKCRRACWYLLPRQDLKIL